MDPKRNVSNYVAESESQSADPAFLPVLLDITHPEITWFEDQNEKTAQQDGHLRLVNDVRGVMYQGDDTEPHYYYPCNFSIKMPKEDGKTKGKASASISCADGRIVEVIRSVSEGLEAQVVAFYAKMTNDDGQVRYAFSKLYSKKFSLGDVTYDGLNASWTFDPDNTAEMSIPVDKGSLFRFPAITKE